MIPNAMRRLLALLLLLPLLACAESTSPAWQEGKHYALLPQEVRVRDPDKIEVVEVFWYGCVHCFHFDPMIAKWHSAQSDDVDFWRSPALWNERMAVHAKAFYTAEALGKLEEIHTPMFTAMNVDRNPLASEAELAAFFAKYGVDRDQFSKVFNSFGVGGAVRQADARARSYRITGTPELIVAGKYRVTTGMAGGQTEMLQVVDYLVQRERAARLGDEA